MRKFVYALTLALAGCLEVPDTLTPIVKSEPVTMTSARKAQIEGVILARLVDPDSAKFRNVRIRDVTLDTGVQERRVCGQFNAKNRMGGYSGFEYFGGVMRGETFVRLDFFAPCEPW